MRKEALLPAQPSEQLHISKEGAKVEANMEIIDQKENLPQKRRQPKQQKIAELGKHLKNILPSQYHLDQMYYQHHFDSKEKT